MRTDPAPVLSLPEAAELAFSILRDVRDWAGNAVAQDAREDLRCGMLAYRQDPRNAPFLYREVRAAWAFLRTHAWDGIREDLARIERALNEAEPTVRFAAADDETARGLSPAERRIKREIALEASRKPGEVTYKTPSGAIVKGRV